jgi:hypothetical protein
MPGDWRVPAPDGQPKIAQRVTRFSDRKACKQGNLSSQVLILHALGQQNPRVIRPPTASQTWAISGFLGCFACLFRDKRGHGNESTPEVHHGCNDRPCQSARSPQQLIARRPRVIVRPVIACKRTKVDLVASHEGGISGLAWPGPTSGFQAAIDRAAGVQWLKVAMNHRGLRVGSFARSDRPPPQGRRHPRRQALGRLGRPVAPATIRGWGIGRRP